MTINLLALETSSKLCSVALLQGQTITELVASAERQQTKQLLPQIQQLLRTAGLSLTQINALAFACGPGSFTGIRLAASLIQGLAFGANVPVIAIPTLQVMAQSAYVQYGVKQAAVALDAYGGKVYWGAYGLQENGQMSALRADALCAPLDCHLPLTADKEWVAVGNGWDVYQHPLSLHNPVKASYAQLDPHAKYVASLALSKFLAGKYGQAATALPIYLYGAEQWKKQP